MSNNITNFANEVKNELGAVNLLKTVAISLIGLSVGALCGLAIFCENHECVGNNTFIEEEINNEEN